MAASLTYRLHLSIILVIFLFGKGARLSTRALVNLSSAGGGAFNVPKLEEPGPPLEGCEANYWDKVCCCFIDAGILQQKRCECVRDARKCERKVRASHHPNHFLDMTSVKKWKSKDGFLSGFQAVEKEFCMAAPVIGPQIESHERAFECTCSTSMGANEAMQCGSGCDVENCRKSNPRKLDWKPFTSGRGTCCLSSFASAAEGCSQEVQPITEAAAKVILTDAVKHSSLSNKAAFLLSEHLVEDMTKSFEFAKQKKVSTSRSGAKFFFSGDYGYILKSIHRPEYDVLYKISHMQDDRHQTTSFPEHSEWNRKRASFMSQTDHCYKFYILPETRNVPQGGPGDLATLTHMYFKGKWTLNGALTEQNGALTFNHEANGFRAFWCDTASSYRISINVHMSLDGCENIEEDALYKWLLRHKYGNSEADVKEVYFDFVKAFEVAPSATEEKEVGHFNCKCIDRWWPSSLINDFVIAFEYRSTTWMVVRNSVTAIQRELMQNGFTSFYRGDDTFDVKPFPIHSDQREQLFGMHFTKTWMMNWRHWDSVRSNLQLDVRFMNRVLDNSMVDYSLLVSAFYINDDRMVLDHVVLPSCVEQPLAELSTQGGPYGSRDYGREAKGSILVCFTVIDMLMEFTFSKQPENLLLFNKWSDWGNKMIHMFDCLGNPELKSCGSYQKLRPKFRGVDIPDIKTAAVQDITEMMSADGELQAIDPVKRLGFTYKCCCNAALGSCSLYDRSGTRKPPSLFGIKIATNRTGCGSLAGSSWHTYWREAGSCRVSRTEAEKIRNLAVVSTGWA